MAKNALNYLKIKKITGGNQESAKVEAIVSATSSGASSLEFPSKKVTSKDL